MNPKTYFLTLALITASTGGIAGQRVEKDNLPAAVQQAVTQHTDGGKIEEITRRTENGRTVYDVRLAKSDGRYRHVTIREDGTVVERRMEPRTGSTDEQAGRTSRSEPSREPSTRAEKGSTTTGANTTRSLNTGTAPGTAGPGAQATGLAVFERYAVRTVHDESALRPEDLPAEVRSGIEREAPGREIADIDRETWQGQTVYEVEFVDSGVNPQLHFTEEGTLLREAADAWDEAKNFFAGTQIADTPVAVQETIRRVAEGGRVTDVDIERRTGRTVYEVEIENDQGRSDIHIAENGDVLPRDRSLTE